MHPQHAPEDATTQKGTPGFWEPKQELQAKGIVIAKVYIGLERCSTAADPNISCDA